MADLFSLTLPLATLLCALVAGFLFAFAVVAMPGLKKLNDPEFIRAFQVIDGIIQNRQPIFIIVWAGSIITLGVATILGISQCDGYERLLILSAAATYLLGVQGPTFAIHIPLNNTLQTVDTHKTNAKEHNTARNNFEPRWNHWNRIRTAFACLTTVQLILLLFKL